MDLVDARSRSLWCEAELLLQTVLVVLARKGAY